MTQQAPSTKYPTVPHGIASHSLGSHASRSATKPVELHSVHQAREIDPARIDPVCRMAVPQPTFETTPPDGPWFRSEGCERAYWTSPDTYHLPLGDGRCFRWLQRYRRQFRTML